MQYHTAAQNPPHLKAIAPCEGLTDRYRQSCYHGGILNYGFYVRWWPLLAVPAFTPLSTQEFSKDELNQKIDVNTDDEIGELSREFNKMTERLRSYEEVNIHQLIAEKKKSETIVESIADPIIVTDEHGTLVLMNTERIVPAELTAKNLRYPKIEEVVARIRTFTNKIRLVDALKMAKNAGSGVTRNTVLLGALAEQNSCL
jgi:transcriptional regulator with PAS, ATPase and Fis domain